jgi:translation initiation factor 1A
MYQSKIREKKKRGGNRSKELDEPNEDEGQEFAYVQDMLGNGRLRALCNDGSIRVGRIAGSLRKYSKKVIIERGDLILITKRDFEQDKVDVVGKYTNEQVNAFLKRRLLPDNITKAITHADAHNYGKANAAEDYVLFVEDGEEVEEGSESDKEGSQGEDEDEDELDIDAI